jgi:hypothetical protein
MIEISVGQVAGTISFGILISKCIGGISDSLSNELLVQLSIPLLLVVVLIGFLQDEHNAVTWYVAISLRIKICLFTNSLIKGQSLAG